MKPVHVILSTFAFIGSLSAKEPASKPQRTVPGPYPSIIQIAPDDKSAPAASKGLIQSELGGREMQFLQDANRAAQEQLALAELAKGKAGSDQIVVVAETIGSTGATETKEIARLAEAK